MHYIITPDHRSAQSIIDNECLLKHDYKLITQAHHLWGVRAKKGDILHRTDNWLKMKDRGLVQKKIELLGFEETSSSGCTICAKCGTSITFRWGYYPEWTTTLIIYKKSNFWASMERTFYYPSLACACKSSWPKSWQSI